jgi:hypothetical protein
VTSYGSEKARGLYYHRARRGYRFDLDLLQFAASGTKEALAVRLRKLAVDGEKTLQEVAELSYQQSFEV